MADIAEQICLAVDQIVTERLKSINFDHTEVATIIDNTNAKDFQYTCSNGSAQYVAYSKDTTFKINDSVQVTIPNNDYTQQKIIIGRYVAKGATPYVFTQPFNTIIDVSANLFDDNEKTISGNLLANEDYDLSEFNMETNSYAIFKKEIPLWNKVFDEGHVNFNRLGLQGQFRSWISSFKTVSGSYGYRLEVLSSNGTTIEPQMDENGNPLPTYEDYVRNVASLYSNNLKKIHDNTLDNVLVSLPDLWYDKIKDTLKLTSVAGDFKQGFIADYNNAEEFSQTRIDMIYALLYANAQITDLYLDSSDMFGNPYNFQTYFEEEKVYDITSLGKIMGLFLFFYEKSGTFYNQDKEYIPYYSTFGSKKPKLNPNLFTKDPYVCLGYDLSGFTEEQAILYSLDGETYLSKDNIPKEKNQKHIRLRWLHEYEDGQIKVVTESSKLSDYEIRWYRFKMGAPSADKYSGVYWELVNQPEVIKETIPLDDINKLRYFYLKFHYTDIANLRTASEYTYCTDNVFSPEYTDEGQVLYQRPSLMRYWSDGCINYYNIPRELADKAFIGNTTSSIEKYVDQKWIDIYKQGFVFHDMKYDDIVDSHTKALTPVPVGCMHKIGFWEKFCLAFRLYWVYPEQFDLLLPNNFWRKGGRNSTELYKSFGKWSDISGKNIYTDISYSGDNLLTNSSGALFNMSSMNTAMGKLLSLFADSFGEWTYITDKYNGKDYVPKDETVREILFTATENFYSKLDNPTYEKITDKDLFSYILEPDPNTDQEQVKVVILHNGKVIRSNIITFYSESSAANIATAELLAGLSLFCTDGSYGNYCLYGQNNNLLNESKTNEILTLQARFANRELLQSEEDADIESPPLEEAKEIVWEFPLSGSMIIVHGFNYSYESELKTACSKNNGVVKRIEKAGFTIDYKECFVDNVLNLTKLHEIDPSGEIFKLEGYYNKKDADNKPVEWISVLGNSIKITRPSPDLKVNNSQQYRIAKTYNASKFNNTVKCQIKRDGLIYSAAKELTFGIMGTNGTDATVVIDFNNNKTALTASAKEESLKVTAHLYDSTHTEVDFNNSGLDLSCEWSWLYYKEFSTLEEDNIKTKALEDFQTRYPEEYLTLTDEDVERIKNEAIAKAATIQIQTDPENEPPNVCFITHEDVLDLSKKFFLVLQVTIKGFGDYDLTSYKAIPIRANPSYRYIIGPTDIVYNSSGYADYYKDPYQMWWSGGEENVNEYDMVVDETKLSMLATTWRIYDPFFETDPKRPDETVSRFIGTVSERNILQPAAIYVKDAKPYGVVCYLNVEGAENSENLCWIQPLTIIQNQYPSTTLNKWDGKTVKIDYENGTIVSPAIAAGKKNSDNTFSGVMIGDWSNTDTATDISKQTGVYGFNHGAMSFSFAEDGTAFIGKSGRGRIMFDGNSGVLKSASWTDTEKTGMYLDLDDGILKLQKDPGYEIIELTADTYSANQYYILKGYYPQVPHNTKFGEDFKYIKNGIEEDFDCNTDTVYYKQGIVPTGVIVAADFTEIKKDAIYIKSRPTYRVCTKEEPFVYETIYYKYSFSEVKKDTLTAEKYSENKYNMYYTKTADDTYVLAGKTFSASAQYYTPQFVPTTTCIEEFNKNQNKNFYIKKNDETAGDYYELAPENSSDFSKIQYYEKRTERAYLKLESLYNKYTDFYYIQVPGSYIKITTSDFNTAQTYYKNGYEAQDYSYKMPDEKTWNQFDISNKSLDSNLHDNEYYYTFFDQFTIASGSFDPNITYYEKNEDASARYITLSAAASRYPLAIGDNSSEQFRKFRVEWDGTCWIEDGMFTGTITANDGVLGNLEVRGELTLSAYGALAANKSDLLDFINPGFYLNGQGLNIGSSANYFLATTSYTGFYNGNGGLRVSGTGLDLYADVSASAAYSAFSTGAQGLVHLGWTQGYNSYPYIRFGRGNEGISTAGLVKKYGGGMWIGDYGSNISDNNPSQDGATLVGLFCCTNGHGLDSHTVYRCEKIGGVRVFEPARYARFA